jgi:hypothetical protein
LTCSGWFDPCQTPLDCHGRPSAVVEPSHTTGKHKPSLKKGTPGLSLSCLCLEHSLPQPSLSIQRPYPYRGLPGPGCPSHLAATGPTRAPSWLAMPRSRFFSPPPPRGGAVSLARAELEQTGCCVGDTKGSLWEVSAGGGVCRARVRVCRSW